MTGPILTVDISHWRRGGEAAEALCRAVDEGLQTAGFLLVTGHGIDPALPVDLRAAARRFFALPAEIKSRYAVAVGGRGWIGPGMEANGSADGAESLPDLKETYNCGAQTPVGDPVVDAAWFPPNVWPTEVPELEELFTEYCRQMKLLSDDLLALMSASLGLDAEQSFLGRAERATWTSNINHYPALTEVGAPEDGQFRIGPHTDFGTVTVLDREPGSGGLQVYTDEGGWADAPYDPAALTINIGDLLEYWTGGRWPAGRHRVLPPQAEAPDEDLMSLIFFYELDHDAVVTPLGAPWGTADAQPPVVAGEFIMERLDAITVTAS